MTRFGLPLPLLLACLAGLTTDVRAAAPLLRALPSTRSVTALRNVSGWVLIGTQGGLVLRRLDDDTRRVLLPGVRIHGLHHDLHRPDAALVASAHGLHRFEAGRLEALSDLPTRAVFAVPSSQLLLTGHDRGLLRWAAGDQHRVTQLPTEVAVQQLAVHEGRVFAGNTEGLWEVDQGGKPSPVRLPGEALARTITWLGVHDGEVHAGTPEGLFVRREGRWRRVGVRDRQVHVTGAASLGDRLWVATAGDGSYTIQRGLWRRVPAELPRTTAFLSIPGGVLVGTPDAGVQSYAGGDRGGAASFDLDADAPADNSITGVSWCRALDTLFVGTLYDGVSTLSRGRWGQLQTGDGLPTNWVNQVASAGRRVLVRVSDGRVAESRDGRSWRVLGTQVGWPKEWTAAVGEDHGRLWVGSYSAYFLPAGDRRWRVYAPKPELDQHSVLDVTVGDGHFWIATHKGGLLGYDYQRDRWSRYSIRTGLNDSWIRCVEWFDDTLWVGTFNQGVSRRRAPGRAAEAEGMRPVVAAPRPEPEAGDVAEVAGMRPLGVAAKGTPPPAETAGMRPLGVASTAPPSAESRPSRSGAPLGIDEWEHVRAADGRLPIDDVHCMLATQEELWIGTMEGLVWTDGRSWATFDRRHGMASGNVTDLSQDGESLWVATVSGLHQGSLTELRAAARQQAKLPR